MNFEIFQHIPGNLQSHANAEMYTCTGKIWEGPTISLLVDLEALCKQKVKFKQSFKLPRQTLKTCSNIYRVPWRRQGDLLISGI